MTIGDLLRRLQEALDRGDATTADSVLIDPFPPGDQDYRDVVGVRRKTPGIGNDLLLEMGEQDPEPDFGTYHW